MSEFKLFLDRVYKLPGYTIGKLYVNGSYFCDTLEDTDRGLTNNMTPMEIHSRKVKGETAIPRGTYNVNMNIKSPKYAARHIYDFCNAFLPRLENVPGYDGILIHIGNYPKDTEGCILVGKNSVKGAVMDSTVTFKRLYEELLKAKLRGDKITITIV